MARRTRVALLLASAFVFLAGLTTAAATASHILLSAEALGTVANTELPNYSEAFSVSLPAGSAQEIALGVPCELWIALYGYQRGLGTKGCTTNSLRFSVTLTVSLCSLPQPWEAFGSAIVVEVTAAGGTSSHCTGCENSECSHDSVSLPLRFTAPEAELPGSSWGLAYEIVDWVGAFQFPDTAGLLCDSSGGAGQERIVANQRAVLPINSYSPEGFLGAFTIRLESEGATAYRITLRLPPQ